MGGRKETPNTQRLILNPPPDETQESQRLVLNPRTDETNGEARRGPKRIWVPQLIASAMLAWALNPENTYSYYILLRWVCCGIFSYLTVEALKREKDGWVWVLGINAVVYNPFIRVHLNRDFWTVINVISIMVALYSVIVLKGGERKADDHE